MQWAIKLYEYMIIIRQYPEFYKNYSNGIMDNCAI